jgi:hypothetical protein
VAGTARTRAGGRPFRGLQGRAAPGRRPRRSGDGQRPARLGLRARHRAAERSLGPALVPAGRSGRQCVLRVCSFSRHRRCAHLALCQAVHALSLGTPYPGLADRSSAGSARTHAAGAAADAGRDRHGGHREGVRSQRLRPARDRHPGEPVRRYAVAPRRMGGGGRARCDCRDTQPVAVDRGGASDPDPCGGRGDRKPLLARCDRRHRLARPDSRDPEAVVGVAAVTRK